MVSRSINPTNYTLHPTQFTTHPLPNTTYISSNFNPPFHQLISTIFNQSANQPFLAFSPPHPSTETYQQSTTSQQHDTEDAYDTFVFYLNVVVIPITAILGVLGNLTSIFVLHKDRYNRVAVFLLQNLALANCFLLLMSVFVLTVSFGILNRVVEDYDFRVLPFIVVYVNPFGSISHCFVIWSTILLALNRYAAICKPFTSKNFLKLSSARIQVAIVFVLSVCFNLPHFFTYALERYYCFDKNGYNDLRCSDNMTEITSERGSENLVRKFNFTLTDLGDNHHFQVYYLTIFYTFIMLILPLVMLIALNVPLIKQLQRSKKQMRHNCLAYDGKNEDNITVAMVVIIIEMVICHVMERICQVALHLSGEEKSHTSLLYAQNISNFFVQLSSSTDFIVYYILKRRFRKEFWRKVHSCLGMESPNSVGESMLNQDRRVSVLKHSLKSDSVFSENNADGESLKRKKRNSRLASQESPSPPQGNNVPDLVVNRYVAKHQLSRSPQIEINCMNRLT